MRRLGIGLGHLSRREFLAKTASVVSSGSVLAGSGVLASCKSSTGPVFEPLPLSVVISGPVEARSNSEDKLEGEVEFFAIDENAEKPSCSWTVKDKLTGEVLATREGSHRLAYEHTGRGTHVIQATITDQNDGRTASTRFETQFLGPKKPYDLIAVVRSEPGAIYGTLNFLDPEFPGSIREEVIFRSDNNLPVDGSIPVLYTNSGITQAPDGENMIFITDQDHNLIRDPRRDTHHYNKLKKQIQSIGPSAENVFPAWSTHTSSRIITWATDRRLKDVGEYEVTHTMVEYRTDSSLTFVGGSYAYYLSNHSGLHDGPHRDFYGKHSSLHPDGFTIAFGPTPFDGVDGEERRIVLYKLTERKRTRFPDETAFQDFLNSHFSGVGASGVRVGENGMAFSPDGLRMAVNIYFEASQKNILAMADLSGGGIQPFADDGRLPSFAPDGTRIGYLNSDNHLLIAPVDGRGPVRNATLESGGQGKHDTAFAWMG